MATEQKPQPPVGQKSEGTKQQPLGKPLVGSSWQVEEGEESERGPELREHDLEVGEGGQPLQPYIPG